DDVVADEHGEHEHRQLEDEGRAAMRRLRRGQRQLLRQRLEVALQFAGVAGQLAGPRCQRYGISHAFSLCYFRTSPLSSPPRKRGSRTTAHRLPWVPAFAGMTNSECRSFAKS